MPIVKKIFLRRRWGRALRAHRRHEARLMPCGERGRPRRRWRRGGGVRLLLAGRGMAGGWRCGLTRLRWLGGLGHGRALRAHFRSGGRVRGAWRSSGGGGWCTMVSWVLPYTYFLIPILCRRRGMKGWGVQIQTHRRSNGHRSGMRDPPRKKDFIHWL